MSARAAASFLALAALGALLSCKEDIPRPSADPYDAGPGGAADVASVDGPVPAPDLAVDSVPASTCGGRDQACCPGNVCNGGGCCMKGQCVANGTPCRADATCLEGSCGGCGATMPRPQECCPGRACTASRTACVGMAGGMCQACGGSGQGCCDDGFCEANLRCDTSVAPPGTCVPR
jgi:hypothetical protein